MSFNNKTFNILKWATLVFVPAVNAATFSILQLWGVDPDVTSKITGSIAILNTLLGVGVGALALQYNTSDEKYDGTIDPLTANMQTSDRALNLSTDEYDAANQKEVLLKVVEHPDSV